MSRLREGRANTARGAAHFLRETVSRVRYGVGLNHLPSGRFAANGAWLAGQVMAHNLTRWTARPGRADRDHQDPPAAVLLHGRAAHPLGTPVDPASSPALALGGAVQPRPGTAASDSTPGQSRPSATDPPSGQLNIPAISLTTASAGRRRRPQSACRSPANFPSTRIRARIIAPVTPSPPFRCPHAVHRWIRVKSPDFSA